MTTGSATYCPASPHSANPAPWVNISPVFDRASARPRSAGGAATTSSPSIPAIQADPSPQMTSSTRASARPGLTANPASAANDSNAAGTMTRRWPPAVSSRADSTIETVLPAGIPMSRNPATRAGRPMCVA